MLAVRTCHCTIPQTRFSHCRLLLFVHIGRMGSLKKRRKAKINKHKRRKKLRAHRHKKRTWQK